MVQDLSGPDGKNLGQLSQKTGVVIDHRGNEFYLRSPEEERLVLAKKCLEQLYELAESGYRVHELDVDSAVRILSREPNTNLKAFFRNNVFVVSPRKTIVPKTLNQREYLHSIRHNDLTFGIGPAGTGKTYLAVALAVSALTSHQVKRIILTRPAVEAGEKLGFLPGDLVEKVNPYLRPLYDALHDMLDFARVQEMRDTGIIEIAPLAFMRGRTLNNAFIILDEAQNTTPEQMKMFLTRLGFGSRAVVTGDVTQIDLPGRTDSGLIQAREVLVGVPGIGMTLFGDEDVIRHPLVGRIVQAYDRWETARDQARRERGK
ncbi:MAG: PhoH family protein [Deltaproteobacteria bacterium]|nr:PhoH family protein [Deltaproteobacteria bacterium]